MEEKPVKCPMCSQTLGVLVREVPEFNIRCAACHVIITVSWTQITMKKTSFYTRLRWALNPKKDAFK